jgi:hypothetical protein
MPATVDFGIRSRKLKACASWYGLTIASILLQFTLNMSAQDEHYLTSDG